MPIKINGPIVNTDVKWIYDALGIEAFSPGDITKYIDTLEPGASVDVEINSPGGHVTAGSEIYTALIRHKGQVNVLITGIAASMASVIAMAGDKVTISPTARIMIHNASSEAKGDYRDLARVSEALKKTNRSIMYAYRSKTGKSEDELLNLMDEETWFEAEEAVNLGFADEILSQDQTNNLKMVAISNLTLDCLLDEKIIDAYQKEKEMLEILNLEGDV